MISLLLSSILLTVARTSPGPMRPEWRPPMGRSVAESISFGDGNSCPPQYSCVSLTNCDAFASRANDRSSANMEFLKSANCGYRGSMPLVCCPFAIDAKPPEQTPKEGCNLKFEVTSRFCLPGYQFCSLPVCGQGGYSIVRVVGGSPATIGDWPWAVAIFVNGRFSCGGTLINENFVLTAAHCVISPSHGGKRIPTSSYTIRLGDLDLKRTDDGGSPITLSVKNAIPHPDFTLSNFHNDIALMQLESPVTYNQFILPACLPSKSEEAETFADMGAILVGWGTTGFEQPASPYLQYVALPIQPLPVCEKAFRRYSATHPIIPSQLCGGLLTGRKDACQGDSGGPLVVMDPNLKGTPWTLVGIVSYGFKCAEVGFPGIYTRVTSFLDWIEQNTRL